MQAVHDKEQGIRRDAELLDTKYANAQSVIATAKVKNADLEAQVRKLALKHNDVRERLSQAGLDAESLKRQSDDKIAYLDQVGKEG